MPPAVEAGRVVPAGRLVEELWRGDDAGGGDDAAVVCVAVAGAAGTRCRGRPASGAEDAQNWRVRPLGPQLISRLPSARDRQRSERLVPPISQQQMGHEGLAVLSQRAARACRAGFLRA